MGAFSPPPPPSLTPVPGGPQGTPLLDCGLSAGREGATGQAWSQTDPEWGRLSSTGVWMSPPPCPTPTHPLAPSLPASLPAVRGFFSSPAAASGPEEFAAVEAAAEAGAGNKGGRGRGAVLLQPQLPLILVWATPLGSPVLRVTEALANPPLQGSPKAALWAIQGVTLLGPLACVWR